MYKPGELEMEQHAEIARPTLVICCATPMNTAMYVG